MRLRWPVKISLTALLVLGALLGALLWPEWRHNPDLSHGLFTPVIFLLLLAESRRAGPGRYLAGGFRPLAATAGLALGGLSLLSAAGLYAAAVGWSHPLVEFLLALAFALLLGAAWFAAADSRVRLMPLNWSAAVAIALWPLSAPIPPGTYTRCTIQLQLMVSTGVLRTLQVLGIAAHRQGNIIELARNTVGVEEACSGVRSLVSCVFASLFFSAFLLRRPLSRLLLIACSIPLALGMNFIRSLILTLLANGGVDIGGAWHDITGYGILFASAAILFGLAHRLVGSTGSPQTGSTSSPQVGSAGSPQAALTPGLRVVATSLALASVLVLGFILNTRRSPGAAAAAPDLDSILPGAAQGWNVETRADLGQFRDALQTDFLAERTYWQGDRITGRQINLYLAYWKPGQAPASFVAAHTPDACWPGTGWAAQPTPLPRTSLPWPGGTLAPAECRVFTNSGFIRRVWFWQVYDRRPLAFENPYSAWALLHLSWRYGFRRDAEQLFVRVSSNRPWPEIAGEPLLREFFERLQPYGRLASPTPLRD